MAGSLGGERTRVAVTAETAAQHCRCGAAPAPGQGAGAAEERFRGLLEAAPDAMVIVDGQGIIKLVNAQTEALFGYRREELLGHPVELLIPTRFRTQHTRHRGGYSANRQVRPMGAGLELHGLRKDGTEFPVEISLSPMETADGLLVSAAVRDVSDRKAAEARINELAALVESSQDAILAKTLDGDITYWNAAAQDLYGYTAEQAIGRHVSMLAPPELRTEVSALLTRLRQGEKVEHFETRPQARRGRTDRPVRAAAAHRADSAAQPDGHPARAARSGHRQPLPARHPGRRSGRRLVRPDTPGRRPGGRADR